MPHITAAKRAGLRVTGESALGVLLRGDHRHTGSLTRCPRVVCRVEHQRCIGLKDVALEVVGNCRHPKIHRGDPLLLAHELPPKATVELQLSAGGRQSLELAIDGLHRKPPREGRLVVGGRGARVAGKTGAEVNAVLARRRLPARTTAENIRGQQRLEVVGQLRLYLRPCLHAGLVCHRRGILAHPAGPDPPPVPCSDSVAALLGAAGRLDADAREGDTRRRRPLLATLTLAGLRISEALDLRWRDVNLAARRLRVAASKTDAGVREVDLTPALQELLAEYRSGSPYGKPGDLVFPTNAGKRDNPSNVRNRHLDSATKFANAELVAAGREPMPDLTPHSLRRTFISLLLAAGADVPYVMAQAGHTDPKMTLGLYAQVIASSTDHGAALDGLIVAAA
jgi:integrase